MASQRIGSWQCLVCDYIHDGDSPPETCPVCGASAKAFERLDADEEDEPPSSGASRLMAPLRWKCSICGFLLDGEAPPATCPICGASVAAFRKAGETNLPPAPPIRWRCERCEAVAEGEAPPERCPRCGSWADLFERIGEEGALRWVPVADVGEVPEGRVKTVTALDRSFALTHHDGRFAVLPNACPHQGGPLGEGSIEEGTLRCPWHGWRFDPLSGEAPGGGPGVGSLPSEVRGDGVYVGLEPDDGVRPRTISDVLVETMVRWGVTHVFGMVGHSNLGLAEAIRRQVELGALTYIGVRHEGAAAFAASAFAKLTGRPAACLSIAGPGATNLLTGLWDAKLDRVPLLALTGQVETQVLGPGAFQEADLAAAFGPVATWSQTVLAESPHGELMSLALKHALLERGVGHLIVPNEVQLRPAPSAAPPSGPEGRLPSREIQPPLDALEQALELLEAARRPVIILGQGARFRAHLIIRLAEKLSCPVLTTFKAKGLLPDSHPLACGVLGRSGTPIASHFMNESDLLLVFGASFSVHTGITPQRPTIQVDYDPLTLGKHHPVTVPLLGEIGVTARMLFECLSTEEEAPWEDRREEIAARWARWRAEKQSRARDDRGLGLSAAFVFDALSRRLPEDAVIAVDVGDNTYSFGRYFESARQSVLMSGYLGSIGFGYPAAIGAWAAAPQRPIVAITGDGGFGQYLGELATAVGQGMKITHVLLNNNELGKISKEQRAARLKVWQTALHNPDFAAYARCCGALGLKVTSRGELDAALAEALDYDGPALVEVMTDAELS